MPGTVERRGQKRIPLRLPVKVEVAGSQEPVMGVTTNLCEKGAFLVLFHDYIPRPEIDFIVEFPPELTLTYPQLVRCKGITRRVEEESPKGLGIAVMIDGYEFL